MHAFVRQIYLKYDYVRKNVYSKNVFGPRKNVSTWWGRRSVSARKRVLERSPRADHVETFLATRATRRLCKKNRSGRSKRALVDLRTICTCGASGVLIAAIYAALETRPYPKEGS